MEHYDAYHKQFLEKNALFIEISLNLRKFFGPFRLNLLLNVGFNQEVGENAALYWNKDSGSLSSLIDRTDQMCKSEIEEYGRRAKERITTEYSWEYITNKYQELWMR